MTDQPNLIILCSDEMRGDCTGFAGNPDVRTPHLDRFAQQATVFEQHFANFPKCVPSRISLMTGRYCHTDGYRTIQQHMRPEQPDLLGALRERGYQAAVFGKNHCWDDARWESHLDYASHREPYGEQFAELETRCKKARDEASMGSEGDKVKHGAWHYLGDVPYFATDELIADQAVDFLTQQRDRNRPFFLQVNLEAPHPPYTVEEPYFSMYDRDRIERWPCRLPENAPLPLRAQRACRTGLEDDPEMAAEVQATYYGMISKVDAQLGRVLDAIEREGLEENSIILFWADHGDYAGQYGLGEKWDTSFADCLTRVPMVIHAPGWEGGKRVGELSDHADLCPTLCHLLGIDPLPGMHGHDLTPTLAGEPVRDAVFSEGGHEDEMLTRAKQDIGRWMLPAKAEGGHFPKTSTYYEYPDSMARARMVRTRDWKMVVRVRGGSELYDLRTDPWELCNRWDDRSLDAVKLELYEKLAVWTLETDTDQPFQKSVGA
ncbi:MAG: sulfatase-like hydrolase/transferase [Phycisphaeraceae bacterium]